MKFICATQTEQQNRPTVTIIEDPDFPKLYKELGPILLWTTLIPSGHEPTDAQLVERDEWATDLVTTITHQVVDPQSGELLAEEGGWKSNYRLYEFLMHYGPDALPEWLSQALQPTV